MSAVCRQLGDTGKDKISQLTTVITSDERQAATLRESIRHIIALITNPTAPN